MESPVNTPQVNKGGRPVGSTKYTREQLEQKLNEYFDNPDNKPYSVLELCYVLDIHRDTLHDWEHDVDKGFSDLITRAKYRIGAGWEKGEKIHPKLSQFLLENHFQYASKQTVEHTGNIIHSMQLEPGQAEAMLQRALEARQRRLAPVIDGKVISAKTEPIPVAIQVDAEETTD